MSEEQEEGEEEQEVEAQVNEEDGEGNFAIGMTKEITGSLREFPPSLPLAVG